MHSTTEDAKQIFVDNEDNANEEEEEEEEEEEKNRRKEEESSLYFPKYKLKIVTLFTSILSKPVF